MIRLGLYLWPPPLPPLPLQNAAIQLNLHLAVSAEAFFGVNLINDLSSE